MAPTIEMLKIAIKYKPNYVCLVPEKRSEITTEGGLKIKKNKKILIKIIKKLKKRKIRVALFIEPNFQDIKISKDILADCVELHTGSFCNSFNKKKNIKKELLNLKKASFYANKIGLEVHAGHGLTYKSLIKISNIKHIREFNIGHFIIADSIFIGLNKSIKNFKRILNK